MTKSEIYNSIIDLYYKSGQGLPDILNEDRTSIIEELIVEGKLKRVKRSGGAFFMPDTFCLTKGYCVEEELEKDRRNMLPLVYIRVYRGVNKLGMSAFPIEREDLIKDSEFMEQYEKWVAENKNKLEEKIEKI